jgi:hypothetical protein
MSVPAIRRMPCLTVLAAVLVLTQPGCEKKSTSPGSAEPYELILLGPYVDEVQGDSGVILLGLEFTGATIAGQAVIRSRKHEAPYLYVYLKGSIKGRNVELDLDTDRIPYQYKLTILATKGSSNDLDGAFSFPSGGLEAEFKAVSLETGDTTAEDFVDLDASVHGLAFDGEDIWVSTVSSDYILMLSGTRSPSSFGGIRTGQATR